MLNAPCWLQSRGFLVIFERWAGGCENLSVCLRISTFASSETEPAGGLNKGSRPQPRRKIVAVWIRRKILVEPGPHCLSPGLAVVPDWLAGGWGRVVWPAGLFPSLAG